jgi:hypothetical protein
MKKTNINEVSLLTEIFCLLLFLVISIGFLYYMIPPKEYTILTLPPVLRDGVLVHSQIYLRYYEVFQAFVLPAYLYFKTLEIYLLNKFHFVLFLIILANIYSLNYILFSEELLLLWKFNILSLFFMLFIYHDKLM